MKIKLSILSLLLISSVGYGQMMGYVTSLKTSGTGVNVAELSLVHRDRDNSKVITKLGSQQVLIPNSINGQELKVENYRFLAYNVTPFLLNGVTYVPVQLYYDMETNDPRDDIFILSIPFEVNRKLVEEELAFYEDEELLTADFNDAESGKPTTIIRCITGER